MSHLSDLIAQLCPDGVEYRKLGEIGMFYGGLTGKSKKDFNPKIANHRMITYKNIYNNPAIDFIHGYDGEMVYVGDGEKQNIAEVGDIFFTGSSETPDECGFSSVLTADPMDDLYLNSFCFGFRLNDPRILLPDFCKHLFRSYELRKQISRTASGVTRFNVSKARMAKVSIPIPPLPVQAEIVRILDNFTELQQELQQELILRRQQYEYYRNQLLTFGPDDPAVEWKKLGEVCSIKTGKLNANAANPDGRYKFFTCSVDEFMTNSHAFDCEAILVPGNGNFYVKHYKGKFDAYQRTYVLTNLSANQLSYRYLYFLLSAFLGSYIQTKSLKGSVPYIKLSMLEDYTISIPPLSAQQRIVNILDKFSDYTTSLTNGLPAEIKLRQQQYEYYRDKLLTFKKAD